MVFYRASTFAPESKERHTEGYKVTPPFKNELQDGFPNNQYFRHSFQLDDLLSPDSLLQRSNISNTGDCRIASFRHPVHANIVNPTHFRSVSNNGHTIADQVCLGDYGIDMMSTQRLNEQICFSEIPPRMVVNHKYFDHYRDAVNFNVQPAKPESTSNPKHPFRGGVAVHFPERLFEMLDRVEELGMSHIVSWQPHGRSFLVHKPKEFVSAIMPHFFRQSKFTSFQRQLNLYGFVRLTVGKDSGSYYHELFLRGCPMLCRCIVRRRIKGNGVKPAPSPSTEPDFYSMERCESTGPKTVNDTLDTQKNEPEPHQDCRHFDEDIHFSCTPARIEDQMMPVPICPTELENWMQPNRRLFELLAKATSMDTHIYDELDSVYREFDIPVPDPLFEIDLTVATVDDV